MKEKKKQKIKFFMAKISAIFCIIFGGYKLFRLAWIWGQTIELLFVIALFYIGYQIGKIVLMQNKNILLKIKIAKRDEYLKIYELLCSAVSITLTTGKINELGYNNKTAYQLFWEADCKSQYLHKDISDLTKGLLRLAANAGQSYVALFDDNGHIRDKKGFLVEEKLTEYNNLINKIVTDNFQTMFKKYLKLEYINNLS